jgi:hypothetical protein
MLTEKADPVILEAQKRGWDLSTIHKVINRYRQEFLMDPVCFSDLLEVLE